MKRNRTLVISALLASLGPLVGNGLYAGPGTDGESILADAREGLPAIAYFAYTLELLGFAALAVLLAWLVAFLFGRAPVAAVTTGIAGCAMLAVKVGSAAPMMVVNDMPDKLDPVTAEALISMNDQSFVVSGFLMSLAFLAAGIGLLATEFPRWLSWWATVVGGLGAVAGVAGVLRPEAYVPVPFLLLLVWMIVVALVAVTRPDSALNVIPTKRTQHQVGAPE
ncbi:MAG: hypothetical protein WB508_11760 [Aeromicrobium sp.]|uniref:hypothetical protein n=1 Tax=Aeromicrobium sp. TaxID=1871063 RepID=UPI003C395FC5